MLQVGKETGNKINSGKMSRDDDVYFWKSLIEFSSLPLVQGIQYNYHLQLNTWLEMLTPRLNMINNLYFLMFFSGFAT